eukprot:scaffold38908_cov239-Skeletonema_dohrnii-CCMP3373.AAC.1
MERMTTQQCNYLLHNRLIRRLGFWSEVVLYTYVDMNESLSDQGRDNSQPYRPSELHRNYLEVLL